MKGKDSKRNGSKGIGGDLAPWKFSKVFAYEKLSGIWHSFN